MESLSALQKKRNAVVSALTNAHVFLWGIFLLIFPLLFVTQFTDVFVLPKELLLGAVVVLGLLLWAVKLFVSEKMSFRKTAFDVPVALFGLTLIISSLLSLDRYDSLIAVSAVIFAIIGFFLITNTVREEKTLVFLTGSLTLSAIVMSAWSVFAYFKVYPLSLPFTHATNFTPLGSALEQLIYLLAVIAFTIPLSLPLLKGKTDARTVSFAVASLLLFSGIIITLLQLIQTAPVILPFETGFQTAFAAISQDAGRIAQGFFFGSGYGTYGTDFTKFKQPSFNTHLNIWTLPFSNSSSYILELLATTGLFGIVTFLFLLFRIVVKPSKKLQNPFFFPLIVLGLGTFVVPFSFIEITVLFIFAALFIVADALQHPHKYFDIEVRFVALKKGLLSFIQANEQYENSKILPYGIGIIFVIIAGVIAFYGVKLAISNAYFENSIVAAAQNNGTATYQDEVQAINIFPYQSDYYRIFSQTNIALANSLVSAFPKNAKPTTQEQNTLYALIQQAITTGKTATQLSPLSAIDWQNLSSIYRSLIGFGQNADTFSILAAQQAIAVDPSNPQEYVALGGIYYQLGQYDNAIRAFEQATSLNPSYANAYYNLGHAYQQKKDFQNALSAYQTVKSLVTTKTDMDQIMNDIQSAQNQMNSSQQAQGQAPQTTPSHLQVNNAPTPAFPAQPTEVPIIPPTGKPQPGTSPTPGR